MRQKIANQMKRKKTFIDELQSVMNGIKNGESAIILGNFNARIGDCLISEVQQ